MRAPKVRLNIECVYLHLLGVYKDIQFKYVWFKKREYIFIREAWTKSMSRMCDIKSTRTLASAHTHTHTSAHSLRRMRKKEKIKWNESINNFQPVKVELAWPPHTHTHTEHRNTTSKAFCSSFGFIYLIFFLLLLLLLLLNLRRFSSCFCFFARANER